VILGSRRRLRAGKYVRCGPKWTCFVSSRTARSLTTLQRYNPTPIRVLIWTRHGAHREHRKQRAFSFDLGVPVFSVAKNVFQVLIANRGEIACRIIRTLDAMGMLRWLSIPKPSPRCARPAGGEAFCVGPPQADQSYCRSSSSPAARRTALRDSSGVRILSETPILPSCEAAELPSRADTAEHARLRLKQQP